MIQRLLIVPAAGHGTRLRAALPKLLLPVNGIAMIDRVLRLHGRFVDRTIVVTAPSAFAAVADHVHPRRNVDLAIQSDPTGMLDAIMVATARAAELAPQNVWISWCDQVAVHPRTVARLAAMSAQHRQAAIVMPTVRRAEPYVHLDRDGDGRIIDVRHRREGDRMPEVGESDMGLFALSADAFFTMLPEYAASVDPGTATRERNFLPFIPWAARHSMVVTFPAEDPNEAIGVNTPDDLHAVETYLRQRGV